MLGSPGAGLPLLSSPSCLMHEPAVETAEARERARGRARERERTEGDANPWHCGSTLSYSNKPNTPAYRKGGNCISVSKGIPLSISHTHTYAHKRAVRHFPAPPLLPKKLTNTNMHTGELQRDYGLLTTAVEYTRKRHKNTKNLRELLFGEVLTSCVDSYQRSEAVMCSEK